MNRQSVLFRALFLAAIGLWLAVNASAQMQFTAISATPEQAAQLNWLSISNETYEIDEADTLETNAEGTITWNQLYTQYPSQGTNTFWLDTGNYSVSPPILHPKYLPARFYRVVDLGPDTTSDEPKVSITSLTNGETASGELTVTVVASTDQPILWGTKLFVDGQEMQMADSMTNYVVGPTNFEQDTYTLNTCEWWNGSHTIFATTKCASGLGDPYDAPTVSTGNAVSTFFPVIFTNLVTEISFSQPFFDPSLGQTQLVTALFAANVNWTLNIEDASSNIALTTTGSGGSMAYNWNGTGTGGTSLPNGIYYYYITAQTNGQPLGGGGTNGQGNGNGPPPPEFESPGSGSGAAATQLWVEPPNDPGAAVPLIIYPPGLDTSGLTVFEAAVTWSPTGESATETPSDSFVATGGSGGGFSPDYSGPSSQSAPRSPKRPPPNPVKGVAGQFAIAYQEFLPPAPSIACPANGLLGLVQLEGSTQSGTLGRLEDIGPQDFIKMMGRGAWQTAFIKEDSQLKASDLRSSSFGGANAFNTGGSFGLVSLHGSYGTSQDATTGANFAEQIYFAVDGRPNTGPSWVRMSEMNLGSAGTNGLKWMVLDACNSLRQQNWNSIRNAGWLPFNGNLHLLLANSVLDNDNLAVFAKKMLGLDGQQRESIYGAWRDSALYCLHHPVQFSVAGYDDCKQDMLTGTNSYTPQGNIFYDLFQSQ